MDLQRRAPHNLRRHVRRAVIRLGVLLTADVATFGLIRAAVRAVRDLGVLGEGIAAPLRQVMPPGLLNGWQFAAALVVGLVVTGNYGAGDKRRDPGRLFLGTALATALPLWMTIWTRGIEVVSIQFALTVAAVWLGLAGGRLGVDRWVAWLRRDGRDAAKTLLVGRASECQSVMGSPVFGRGSEFECSGFVDVEQPASSGAAGHVADLPVLLAAMGVEAVMLCGPVRRSELQSVVDCALASGCQVLAVPPEANLPGVEPAVEWRGGRALVRLTAPSLRGQQLIVKRALDLWGAVFGIVALSPLFVLLAVMVKLDSRGPILFRQVRVGRGGRPFRIAKFRTMRVGAEAEVSDLRAKSIYGDGRLFKVQDDPRVTRLGRWLRRTSLDEFPQLLNVLRGEMSLVGPRPPLPSEVELYEAHHYARFDVKPGMTGPWQVGGRNEINQFEEVVKLETQYIRDWSLWSDLVILARTAGVVLGGRGAH